MRDKAVSPVLILVLSAVFSIPVVAAAAQRSTTLEPKAQTQRADTRRPDEMRFLCGRQKLADSLAHLDPGVPHTIRVYGACRENIAISGFTRLTLLAAPGASISDASGGTDAVVQVLKSSTVDFEGFTVNGGVGVSCLENSTCTFVGNTFRGSLDVGVVVARSYADLLSDNLIQNSAGDGLAVVNGAVVRAIGLTVENSGGNGASVNSGANLSVFGPSSILNSGGSGIRVFRNSTLRVSESAIQGNGGDGISVESASEVQEALNSITNNGSAGVSVGDLSFVAFSGESNITGNLGGTDVLCLPQFSATRGALENIGGGSTNCIEP